MAREAARPRYVRLIVMPACLFLGVSAAVFLLSQLSLAAPGAPQAAAGGIEIGDAYRGEVVYAQTCAGCHGEAGEGAVGPRLAGSGLTAAAVKARVESGGGTMPAGLVTGTQLADLLAHMVALTGGEGD